MSQARLLFSEAWASIRMNLSTTFAATMTVLIGMCLLGLFIALGTWVLSWSNHVQKELQVHVYFQNDATQAAFAYGSTHAFIVGAVMIWIGALIIFASAVYITRREARLRAERVSGIGNGKRL